MANPVDVVIGSEAIKQVQNLVNQLNLADAELLKLSQTALQAGKNISGISTPKGFNDSLANNAKINQELERQNKIIEDLEIQIKKLSYARQNNNKQSAEEVVNQRILNQNALAEAKAVSNLVGAYQKLDLEHKKALKNAQDIGAQYGITSDKFIKASQKANELDVRLKEIDSTLGKNNRYVGEYGRGFNALGNSINQLTREAPAFANSINTGFMAISNNIPALTDAIQGLREQNKLLAAEGKPTTSVLSQLGSAFFSWNTLISVGVTLLTVYGGKLIDFVFNTNEAKKATDSLTNSMKLNEEQVRKNISNLEYNNKIAIELAKKRGASETELHDLQKKLGIETVSEYEKNYKNITDRLRSFDDYRLLQAQGGNKAFMFLLKKFNGDVSKARDEYNRREVVYTDTNRKILADSQNKAYDDLKKQNDENVLLGLQYQNEELQNEKDGSEKIQNERDKAEEDRLKAQAEARRKELELQLANIDIRLNNEDIYYTERLSALDEDFLKRVEIAKLDYDEENRLAKGNQEKQKTALINFQLEKIKLLEDYNKKKNQLEALDLNAKGVQGGEIKDPLKSVDESAKAVNERLKEFADNADDIKKKIAELQKETDNWLGSFSAEFFQNSGLGSLQTFFDGSFKELLEGSEEDFSLYFNAIAESAQETVNFISSISQQSFDEERNRLQNQYDVAYEYANGNKAAQEKLATDLEKKKTEIANRENKAKQKQAIFNIAIDTAQAIVASLKTDPTGILAIAIAALGAVQIGLVAAQKIPQYAEGTDNHTGGLMLVNDAKGASYQEKIIFPNGKEFMPQGRNVLMDAPAGTKVLTPEQQLMQALNGTNINLSKETINRANGMTAEQMDYVLGKHFGNITTNTTIFDENGMRTWSEKNGSKTIKTNNRVTRTGIRV